MRRFIYLSLFIVVHFLACNSPIDPKQCGELIKGEVFSLGYPNITFMVNRTEKEVRANPQKVIFNKEELKRIRVLIKNLNTCTNQNEEIKNFMGLCDLSCSNNGRFTVKYDGRLIQINDIFYCNGDELVKELFGKK